MSWPWQVEKHKDDSPYQEMTDLDLEVYDSPRVYDSPNTAARKVTSMSYDDMAVIHHDNALYTIDDALYTMMML